MSSPRDPSPESFPLTQTQFIPKSSGEMYTILSILDERPPDSRGRSLLTGRKSRGDYLVDWAGTDPETGEPWEKSWVEKSDVTSDMTREWKRRVKENPGLVGVWAAKLQQEKPVTTTAKGKKSGKGKRKRRDSTVEAGPSKPKKSRSNTASNTTSPPAIPKTNANRRTSRSVATSEATADDDSVNLERRDKGKGKVPRVVIERRKSAVTRVRGGVEDAGGEDQEGEEEVIAVRRSKRSIVTNQDEDVAQNVNGNNESNAISLDGSPSTSASGSGSTTGHGMDPTPAAVPPTTIVIDDDSTQADAGANKDGKRVEFVIPGTPSQDSGTQSSGLGSAPVVVRRTRRGKAFVVVSDQSDSLDQEQGQSMEVAANSGEEEQREEEIDEDDESETVETADEPPETATDDREPENSEPDPDPPRATAEEARAAEEEFRQMQTPMGPLAPFEADDGIFSQSGEGQGVEFARYVAPGDVMEMDVDMGVEVHEHVLADDDVLVDDDISASQMRALDEAVKMVLADRGQMGVGETIEEESFEVEASKESSRGEQKARDESGESLEAPSLGSMVPTGTLAEIAPQLLEQIQQGPVQEPPTLAELIVEDSQDPAQQSQPASSPLPLAEPPHPVVQPPPKSVPELLPATSFFPGAGSVSMVPATQESTIEQFPSPARGYGAGIANVVRREENVDLEDQEDSSEIQGAAAGHEGVVAMKEGLETVVAAPANAVDVSELEAEIAMLKAAVATRDQRITHLEARHALDIEGIAFQQQMYTKASKLATEHAQEASLVRSENKILQGQVKLGLRQKEDFYKAALQAKDGEIRLLKGQNKLHLDKDRLTNDNVRRKAAQFDSLHKKVRQLQEEIDELAFEKERLQQVNDRLRGLGDDSDNEDDSLPNDENCTGARDAQQRSLADMGYDNYHVTSSPTASAYYDATGEGNQSLSVAEPSMPVVLQQSDIPAPSVSTVDQPSETSISQKAGEVGFLLCKWWIAGRPCGFASQAEKVMQAHCLTHVGDVSATLPPTT